MVGTCISGSGCFWTLQRMLDRSWPGLGLCCSLSCGFATLDREHNDKKNNDEWVVDGDLT